MKPFLISVVASVLINVFTCCHSQTTGDQKQQQVAQDEVINVYYVHFTRRCATCQAVEEQSALAIEVLFPDQFKSGKIVFTSLNLEEPSSDSLAESLQVSGQALLIVKGDKKIDLTNEGFLYARTHPEKLQQKIKHAIDPML